MIKGPPVELQLHITAPPEVVFPYLVEPDQLVRWMGEEARVDARAGGTFWLRVQGDDVAMGEYLTVDPPNQVVVSWGWQGSAEVPPGSSVVTFDLRADGEGTLLSLTHTDLPHDWCDRHREGWAHHLPALTDAVGH